MTTAAANSISRPAVRLTALTDAGTRQRSCVTGTFYKISEKHHRRPKHTVFGALSVNRSAASFGKPYRAFGVEVEGYTVFSVPMASTCLATKVVSVTWQRVLPRSVCIWDDES